MHRILVVDDDTFTCTMMVAALERPDREITTAGDGEEALLVARTFVPHLVVTDVSMPRRSGFELAEALAERRNTALAAIIFVTGLNAPEQRVFGLRLGAVDYLTKPFAIEELVLRVENALRHGTRARQLFEHGLVGNFSQLSFPTLLNVLSLERKTGELELGDDTHDARLLIRDGDIVAAYMDGGEPRGAACVYALLGWNTGRFAFEERPVTEPDEIGVPTMALLLEGARRNDEATAATDAELQLDVG